MGNRATSFALAPGEVVRSNWERDSTSLSALTSRNCLGGGEIDS